MRVKSLQQVIAILLIVACLPTLTGCTCGCCSLVWGGLVAGVAALLAGGTDIVDAICDVADLCFCPDDQDQIDTQ